MGEVEDIADAVCFMCSSLWMNGSILTIDGGMIARANMPFRPRPSKSTSSTLSSSLKNERSGIDFDALACE